jgi:galactose mutarotase-like enzyme
MEGSGIAAAKKENVLIRAGDCVVRLLPEFGGKIASIRVGKRELLQQPLAPILPRTRTMSFDAGDASGWDECLPSVAACTVKTGTVAAKIPDHGDLWRVEWMRQETGMREKGSEGQEQSSVFLRGECFSLPLVLERSIAIAETKKGWRLSLGYEVTNRGNASAPWSWAVHPLFAVNAGDRIELPASIKELRVEGSGQQRLGKTGDHVAWPVAKLAGGGETDVRVVEAETSKVGDKLFAGPLKANENWCTLSRPQAGVRIRMSFDAALTPYLGLWLCYGGWPERPGPKQMCVAMEPATAPVDSLAVTGPWSRMLEPSESFSWPLEVDLETL